MDAELLNTLESQHREAEDVIGQLENATEENCRPRIADERRAGPAGLKWVTIEAGQSWVSKVDGSAIIVQGRSDLLVHWWKVRSSLTGRTRSIDGETLRTLYRPQRDENASSSALGVVAA